MKKIIILILAALLAMSAVSAFAANNKITIDRKSFPDTYFRRYVKQIIDKNGDGSLSSSERNAVTSIDVSSRKIKKLTGIEYFTNLKTLSCENNKLTRLDLSRNTSLKYLACRDNELTSLILGKKNVLQELDASRNRLAKLDLGGCPKLKKIVNTHIIVERYREEGVLGWRLGYPHPMYTDANTVLLDGDKVIYKAGKVKAISLTEKQKNVTLKVGQLWQPQFTVTPSTAACFIQAEPKNRNILEVPYDDNTMKAKRKGTTVVTIKTEYGQTAKIKVTVR